MEKDIVNVNNWESNMKEVKNEVEEETQGEKVLRLSSTIHTLYNEYDNG